MPCAALPFWTSLCCAVVPRCTVGYAYLAVCWHFPLPTSTASSSQRGRGTSSPQLQGDKSHHPIHRPSLGRQSCRDFLLFCPVESHQFSHHFPIPLARSLPHAFFLSAPSCLPPAHSARSLPPSISNTDHRQARRSRSVRISRSLLLPHLPFPSAHSLRHQTRGGPRASTDDDDRDNVTTIDSFAKLAPLETPFWPADRRCCLHTTHDSPDSPASSTDVPLLSSVSNALYPATFPERSKAFHLRIFFGTRISPALNSYSPENRAERALRGCLSIKGQLSQHSRRNSARGKKTIKLGFSFPRCIERSESYALKHSVRQNLGRQLDLARPSKPNLGRKHIHTPCFGPILNISAEYSPSK